MYNSTDEYRNYTASSLIRKPLSKIRVNNIEYTSLKQYPKVEHSTESLFGTFPSKSCEFELYDLENVLSLVGKEIEVYRGLTLPSGNEWIPMGIFKADARDVSIDTSKKTVKFKGYDKATDFDIAFNPENHTYPCTLTQFLQKLCQNHGIELETADFPMSDLTLSTQPEIGENVTERELISKAAELGGCIAQITRNGKLRISKPKITGMTLSSQKYKTFSQKKPVYITSLILRDNGGEDVTRKDGTNVGKYGDHVYTIQNNPFIKGRLTEVADEIAENILNMNLTPFELVETVDDFILDLNDEVTVTTKRGETVKTTLLSLSTQNRIKSTLKAELKEEKASSVQGSIKQQLFDAIKRTDDFHTAHQTFLKTLKDGLDKGLYQTVKKSADGSSVTYYHDTPQLENATYIQVFTSTGRAWTQGSGCWNGGDPNWQYGENKDGDAILRDLLIRTLTADLIRTGKLSSFDGKTYFDLDNANFHTENEYTESGTTYLDIADIANGIATFSKVEKDADDTSNSPTTMVGKAGILSLGPSPKLNSEIIKRYLPDNYESLSLLEKMLAYSTALVKAIFYNMYGFNAITSDTESGNLLYMHSDGNGISFIQLNSEDDENTSSTAYYGKDGAEAPDFTISKFDGTNDLSIKDALDAIEKYVTPRDFRNEVTFESGEEGTYNSIFMLTGSRVDINYQGTAKAHSSNDLLFTLPSSLFPPHQVHVSMVKNAGAYGTVVIGTDGKARVNFISNTNTQTRIYFQATYYIN